MKRKPSTSGEVKFNDSSLIDAKSAWYAASQMNPELYAAAIAAKNSKVSSIMSNPNNSTLFNKQKMSSSCNKKTNMELNQIQQSVRNIQNQSLEDNLINMMTEAVNSANIMNQQTTMNSANFKNKKMNIDFAIKNDKNSDLYDDEYENNEFDNDDNDNDDDDDEDDDNSRQMIKNKFHFSSNESHKRFKENVIIDNQLDFEDSNENFYVNDRKMSFSESKAKQRKNNDFNRNIKEDSNHNEDNNEKYCICKDISYGDMIMCDNQRVK
jgi:hypothetical protein